MTLQIMFSVSRVTCLLAAAAVGGVRGGGGEENPLNREVDKFKERREKGGRGYTW